MNNIRGRILLAFLTLCLCIAPFIIFSYSSLGKISKAKALKEQVALFNINRLKAANKFLQVLDTDTKIDSFYVFNSTTNLRQHDLFVNSAEKALHNIQTAGYTEDRTVIKRLENIQIKLTRLKSNIDSVLGLQSKRGFRDFGMEGTMRKYIHSLEEDAEGITLAENLMLRRREKDFFLRDDPYYAGLLNQECDSIIKRMSADIKKNGESLAILRGYRDNFNAIVVLEGKIGNEHTGFLKEVKLLNEQLDNEVNKLYEIVDTNLSLLTNSIRSYVLLFFGITVLFAIFFSFIFSGHIARPLKQLINDMDYIVDKNFKGSFKARSRINLNEINRLTDTYNNLVQKIQSQINHLNENNRELNLLNEKLKESENELKEASKVKDKFFSIISHDLRGHTGNVLSLAQILNDGAELSENEKSVFIKYLMESSQNLQLLLDNLLNWAKTQMNDHDLSPKAFNLNKLIEQNMELFADNAFRKGVKIGFEPSEIPKAYADKDMVDFVLRNLLSNALKFTKEKDRITLNVIAKDTILKISIKDTGVGMTEKQINTLLNSKEGGFTTKGTKNEVGTGLGFSICKDFVKRNRGSFEIQSEKGKGSTFAFTLPTSLTAESILSH